MLEWILMAVKIICIPEEKQGINILELLTKELSIKPRGWVSYKKADESRKKTKKQYLKGENKKERGVYGHRNQEYRASQKSRNDPKCQVLEGEVK